MVIADEAHRSQYDFIDGFARHMRDALPSASFIGFTGTPIELQDANTRAVFGDYISVYDIQRAVQDGATVPIYYESRLAKLALDEAERPKIDPEFEEATEGEEVERKEKLKTKWAQLEAVVGAEKRLALVARDIVEHFEKRLEAMDGKAMVVCMSRRICVDLYKEIVKLRPAWHHADDDDGRDQGRDDRLGLRPAGLAGRTSATSRAARHWPTASATPKDQFKFVIVRDMWLTGFDAPSLHTMYVDKPMRGHGLMQAIARVNRVFKDKPGGLVVDYLGLAQELKQALADYTESGGTGRTALDQERSGRRDAGEIRGLPRPASRLRFGRAGPPARRNSGWACCRRRRSTSCAQENGKDRYLRRCAELSQAFALAVPHDDALRIRDDVAFFQAVQAGIGEAGTRRRAARGGSRPGGPSDHLPRGGVRKVSWTSSPRRVSRSPTSRSSRIEFLAEVRGMPQRNLAVELLQKLLKGELAARRRKNLVQARSFADMLEQTIRRYQNRAIEAAQVIEELIQLAKDMRAANARGEALGLTEDELAFYDALETNDSAVKVLGDETLRAIARELVATVRNNVTIDWTLRENVRAQMRVLVRRILRRYGYSPDKQEKAMQTVLEQAELLSQEWPA